MKRCYYVYFYSVCASLLLGESCSHIFLPTPKIFKGRDASNDSSVCKGDNGQFSDPKYCDKYYDCWEGRPVSSGQCSHGLMFNEATSSCDYPSNVNCDGKEVAHPPQDLAEGCEQAYGTFASPRNCAEYTVCHAGIASYFRCDEGLAFDKEQKVCALPHNPLCLETNLPNDRPEGEGLEELPLDPDNIQPAPPPGPVGGDGGGQFPVPDWPKTAKCPSISTGFFPVAQDCQSVVVCLSGKGFLLRCPEGSYYHPRAASCRPGKTNSCEQMKIMPSLQKSSLKVAPSSTLGAYRYAYFNFKLYPRLPLSN